MLPPDSTTSPAKTKKAYVPAVGPRLRKILYMIFALTAVLGANSAYLAAITAAEWTTGRTYQNHFYQYMFLGHLVLGLVLIVPVVLFGLFHIVATRHRKNRRAMRIGYVLFAASLIVLATGVLLMRIGGIDLRQPVARNVVYWLHVACPLVAAWLYWLHRLAGPRIKWRLGLAYVLVVGFVAACMTLLHTEDPRNWYAVGPESGTKYFEPSLARTSSGNFIPAEALTNDTYCLRCHADVHAQWSESAHRFSSFNNPPYLASVSETREVALKRDGNVQASRWCAGCHDPAPFFSGAFDDPNFDMQNHPTAHAGITCSVCHAITHVNSTRGNADFTIEEPLQYPFAYSDNPALQWINNQLIKSKPEFHKKTFMKDFHRSAEFCSTCHKVSLPYALNNYKEFLRGQNHYDPFLLSGVSGHGARSFYYPAQATPTCAGCHMPLKASGDFGAQMFPGATALSVHDHLFPGANTGVPWLRRRADIVEVHQQFMKDTVRVDLFGIRDGGEIDDPLIAPLRPQAPTLVPGRAYLFDVVIRTLKLGHLFTQGTVDSNEVWLDVTVKSGDRVVGRSGGIDSSKGNEVDPWSHFVNVFMLDKDGNRIDRRNPQDIFTPLYNHQIPPGAGQTVHYSFTVPEDLDAPLHIEVKLQYRKFDARYMEFVAANQAKLKAPFRGDSSDAGYQNELPITTLAYDAVTLGVEGVATDVSNPPRDIPPWQRWNDYGIGLLLKGKAELRQAGSAFAEVETLKRWDGPMNLARAYLAEGRLDEAVAALNRAEQYSKEEGFPRWTWAWLSGDVNRQQGRLEEAITNLSSVLNDRTEDMQLRGFDFSKDYEVINLLALTQFDLGRVRVRQKRQPEAAALWGEAITNFQKTLALDSENATAHHGLQLLYAEIGDEARAREHEQFHLRFKPDDNAQGRAEQLARRKYPAANFAAEAVVRYPLQRAGAPELVDPAVVQAEAGDVAATLDAAGTNREASR
jgi:tetratricopeptide (TPR) repeat protein